MSMHLRRSACWTAFALVAAACEQPAASRATVAPEPASARQVQAIAAGLPVSPRDVEVARAALARAVGPQGAFAVPASTRAVPTAQAMQMLLASPAVAPRLAAATRALNARIAQPAGH